MKLEINITKGKFWTLVVLCIGIIGVIVLATAGEKPNPGHDVSDIYYNGQPIETVLGISYNLVCATAKVEEPEGNRVGIQPVDIPGGLETEEVFTPGGVVGDEYYEVSCNQGNGWLLTGCTISNDERGEDTDLEIVRNGCRGDNDDEGTGTTTFIRCCKIETLQPIPTD